MSRRGYRRFPILTDWVAFTPTGGWSTNSTYVGRWRRVGDTMEIQVEIDLGGAPNAASLTINLPSGYSIDTAKVTGTASASGLYHGLGGALDTSAGSSTPLYVEYSTTTAVLIRYSDDTAGYIESRQTVNATAPWTWASGDIVFVRFSVPINGWRANR